METEPMQRCDNCRQLFAESKMATHFGYCRRNIKKCQTCGEMYDINSKEEHQQQFHKKQNCHYCKKEFSLAQHRKHEQHCQLRSKFCQYCELNVPVAGFETHFKACQSRTKPCTKCNKPIMNKDYIVHIISCTGIVEEPKRANNYAEYLNQYQKKAQVPTHTNNRINSRQKPQVHGLQRPKQQKQYANIIRPVVEQPKVQVKKHEQRIFINYPHRQQQKKESKEVIYHRQQAKKQQIVHKREEVRPIRQQNMYKKQLIPQKRQQIKRYSGIVNAPINGHIKKDQSRPPVQVQIQKLNQPSQQYQHRPNENPRFSANKEPTRVVPTSNKQIISNQIKHYPIKQAKSMQRINPMAKRQEENRQKYANQNINPKKQYEYARVQQNKYKVPVVPRQEVPQERQRPQEYVDHYSQNFDLSAEEQQLQQIILQSMGEQNKHKKPVKSVVMPHQKAPNSFDIPYIEGEDLMNESFIEKQRAIEEQFFKNKARR